MFSCFMSNSVLFMTSSNYVSSLRLPVAQMVIFPVRVGFVDDAKYLFITVIIFGR